MDQFFRLPQNHDPSASFEKTREWITYLRGWCNEPKYIQQQRIHNCLSGDSSEPLGSSPSNASSSTPAFAVHHTTGWSPPSSPKTVADAWTNPSKFSVKHRLVDVHQPDPSKLRSRVIKTYYPFNPSLAPYENLLGAWLVSTNVPKFSAASHETVPNEELPSYFKHYLSFHTIEFEDMVRRDIYSPGQPSVSLSSSTPPLTDDDSFEALERELRNPLKTDTYTFLGSRLPQNRIHAQELLVAFSYLPFGILLEDIPKKNFLWALNTLEVSDIGGAVLLRTISTFKTLLSILIDIYKSHKVTFDCFIQAKEDYEYEHHRGYAILKDIEDLRSDPFATIDAYSIDTMSKAELDEVLDYISNVKLQKEEAVVDSKDCLLNLRRVKKVYEELLPLETQLEANESFFKYCWATFHNLVTLSFPHFFEVSTV